MAPPPGNSDAVASGFFLIHGKFERAAARRSAGVTGKLPDGALGRAYFLLSSGVRARGVRMPDKAVIRFLDQYERKAQSEEGIWEAEA